MQGAASASEGPVCGPWPMLTVSSPDTTTFSRVSYPAFLAIIVLAPTLTCFLTIYLISLSFPYDRTVYLGRAGVSVDHSWAASRIRWS